MHAQWWGKVAKLATAIRWASFLLQKGAPLNHLEMQPHSPTHSATYAHECTAFHVVHCSYTRLMIM